MKSKIKFLGLALAAAIGMVLFFTSTARPQVNCSRLSHWSGSNPPVSQTHIFCGEWDSRRSRPKGFHSRPNGINPRTVANFRITQRANSQGIYGATWSYAGQSGKTKFSTMFPDRCSQQQVLKSILYAAAHRQSCPSSAPNWAWCGPSAPAPKAQRYCNGNNGSVFSIAGASLRNGNINTAFPLR
ncbi:MAG: EndoU domain-containing protein [Oscillatoria sp. SIO1A7]|nr:EndoU domain-containing protein [Oscillatoria sp. SIO1A7]